jgi:hypothetical protein
MKTGANKKPKVNQPRPYYSNMIKQRVSLSSSMNKYNGISLSNSKKNESNSSSLLNSQKKSSNQVNKYLNSKQNRLSINKKLNIIKETNENLNTIEQNKNNKKIIKGIIILYWIKIKVI